MEHVKIQALLTCTLIVLLLLLLGFVVIDVIQILCLGWNESSLKSTGILAATILGINLLKYFIDASTLYWALSGDISRGVLKVTQVQDDYVYIRAEGVDHNDTIEISKRHHALSELDMFHAVVRYPYTGDVVPIGTYGAFLLLLKAKNIARRKYSEQLPTWQYVKRWREGDKQ